MGAQRSDGIPPKQAGSVVGKPVIKTNVLRDLKESRARRDAQDVSRDFKKTIAHLDEVAKMSSEAHKCQDAVLDAATTGHDPEINELSRKKAAVSVTKKAPTMECSGGVCRIVRKKKK
jgi:hypothetical protein